MGPRLPGGIPSVLAEDGCARLGALPPARPTSWLMPSTGVLGLPWARCVMGGLPSERKGNYRRLVGVSSREVEVGGDACAVALEGFEVAGDAFTRDGEVLVVEVEVEQVDVPGRLDVAADVGGDDLAGDG